MNGSKLLIRALIWVAICGVIVVSAAFALNYAEAASATERSSLAVDSVNGGDQAFQDYQAADRTWGNVRLFVFLICGVVLCLVTVIVWQKPFTEMMIHFKTTTVQ